MTAAASSPDPAARSTPEPERRAQLLDPQAFLDFCKEILPRIYRFHLALLGTTTLAQEWTADTFRQAAKYFPDSQDLTRSGEKLVFELACAQHTSTEDKPQATDLVDLQQASSFDFQILQISQRLHLLPTQQGLLLSLHFFGGVDLPVVAKILGFSQRQVENTSVKAFHRWLTSIHSTDVPRTDEDEISLAQELFDFARRITPGDKFSAELMERLRKELPEAPPIMEQVTPPMAEWRRKISYQEIRQRSWGVATLVGIFVLVFLFFKLAPQQDLTDKTNPTGTSNESAVQPAVFLDSGYQDSLRGSLVPPTQTHCEIWQARLETELGGPVALSTAEPLTVFSTETERRGSACVLRISAPGSSSLTTDAWMGAITEDLIRVGYQPEPDLEKGLPLDQITRGSFWYGQGAVFSQADQVAFLAVGWTPDPPDRCANNQAEVDCTVDDGQRTVSLRLELAEDRLRPRVDEFFQGWAAQKMNLVDYLTPDLLVKTPNFPSLDNLAQVRGGLIGGIDFHWQILENDGHYVRMLVEARGTGQQDPFQVNWTLDGDTWRVNSVSTAELMPPSSDVALVADGQGRLLLLGMDGSLKKLSQEGVYTPDLKEDSSIWPLVSVSPNGKWAAVSAGHSIPARLVAIDGSRIVRYDSAMVAVGWSPDSRSLAMVMANRANSLYFVDPETNSFERIFTSDGLLEAIAWSPDGKWIGFVETQTSPYPRSSLTNAGDKNQVVKIYSVKDKVFRTLGVLNYYPGGRPDELAWTADSQQLWYQGKLAYSLDSGLVTRVIDLEAADLGISSAEFPYRALQTSSNQAQRSTLSPDGQQAVHLDPPSGTDGKAQTVRITDERIGAGKTDLVTQQMTPVVEAQWTQEGDSLVLSSAENRLGQVWQMSALSGDLTPIGDRLILIGLISQLQRESASVIDPAPVETGSPVEEWYSTDMADWMLASSDAWQFQFAYPSSWEMKVQQAEDGSSLVFLANLDGGQMNQRFGIAPGTQAMMVWVRPWRSGENAFTFLRQVRETGGPEARIVLINGRLVVLSERSPGKPTEYWLQIPTQDQLIQFDYIPTNETGRIAFLTILRSITITDPLGEAPSLVDANATPEQQAQVEAVTSAVLADSVANAYSADGRWQAEVRRYASGETNSGNIVEDVLISDQKDYTSRIPVTYLLPADGSGGHVGNLFWSANSEQVYFNPPEPAAEKETACPYTQALLAGMSVSTGRLFSLEQGSASSDGKWMAYWEGDDLLIWDVDDAVRVMRIPGLAAGYSPGPIAWSPDDKALVYVLYEAGCPAGGSSSLVGLNLDRPETPDHLLTQPAMEVVHIEWTEYDGLSVTDQDGQEWKYQP